MGDPKPYIDALNSAFQAFATNKPTTAISVVGLFLLVITLILAIQAMRSEKSLGLWYRFGLVVSLVFGILCSLVGPGYAIIQARTTIAAIERNQAFENLKQNSRVSWLIRLIVFDPQASPYLEVGKFEKLGPPANKYTFVASYEELRGYHVSDAVRMTGGIMRSRQHVSVVIFPRPDMVYPANARGLLQVIDEIERGADSGITNSFNVKEALNADEQDNLLGQESTNIGSWSWPSYGVYYKHYCDLTFKFRQGNYDAKRMVGDVNKDWNPLGFSRKDTETLSPNHPASSVCDIKDWNDATTQYGDAFGARAFLVKNDDLISIPKRILFDFEDPDREIIPDIWNDRSE